MKSVLPQSLTGFLLLFSVLLSAQSAEYWSFPESKINFTQDQSLLSKLPAEFKQVELDIAGLYQFLADASKGNGQTPFKVSLPNPEGNFTEFMLVPTTVAADEVAHLYSVQTFKGYAPGSPQVRIRCDVSSTGFHAVVFFKSNQTYVIEPQSKTSASTHLVYYKSELPKADFPCEVKNHGQLDECSVGGDFRSASTFFDMSDATFSLTATDCNGNEIEPVILAEWTFETSVPTTAGPHTPEAGLNSASSEAIASHASGSVTYSNPAGNGSTESFNSNNWTAGDYYQIKVPTTGYEQISISWDQTRSGTGPESFQLQWSTDGANFASVLDYSISDITWSSTNYNANSTFTANLPANTANEAMVWVRLVSLVTTASGGTNRVDNIVLTGLSNAVPGNPCDDGIPCTINDTWDNDCNCLGILQDTDGDGICDGEDTCPNVPNSEIRSIVVDGNITDFGPAIANGANGVNYYFSADDDFFYVGVTGVDHNNDNIHIAFSTNDGSTTAANWGVNWDNAPYSFLISIFGSDNICYYPFNDPYGCQQVGTTWANYAGFSGNLTTELRIPRSFLGSLSSGSGAVNLSIWTNNNAGNFVWSTYPTSNPTGPANVNWVEFGQQAYPTYLPQDPAAEDECGECILDGESNPLWNVSCADCEGVANGTALPGTACDDGDPSTGNDTYDTNCICVGMLIDCEGVPGGSALPGTLCDDGDPNTENDQYNNDCECVGTPIGGVTLSGVILWEHDDSGVPLAEVDLMQGLNLEDNTQTSATGAYSFSVSPDNSTYDVVPSKTPVPNAPNCGVTVLDVQLIQQHVTFVNIITDPYKLIAADVNRDDKISTLDALLVAQTLLGNPFASAIYNQYWRFVDANYNFPVPASPWGFPETIEVPNVTNSVMDLDFHGIIIGDVNGSGNPDNSCNNVRSGESLVWFVEDQPLTHYGQEIELAFYPEQFESLSSYQFGLGFHTSHLQLLDIQPGTALPLTAEHFGAHLANVGELRAIWWDETDNIAGISLRADEPVFTLRFKVLRTASSLSDHLWADEQVMSDFAYDSEQQAGGVGLTFTQSPLSNTVELDRRSFHLYQNVPNPFNKKTRIGFYLPEACQARLNVYDVTGQLLYMEEANYSVGFHEVIFQKPDNASGILYYQLQTPFGTAVKKMIGL